MTNRDDGGPAFPFEYEDHQIVGFPRIVHAGMSLRDYFAGIALPCAIDAALANLARNNSPLQFHEPTIAEAASGRAYLIADAMLKERDRK